MRKPDEIALARAMLTYDPHPDTGEGQPLHVRMGIPAKRWKYIISKWKRRGWIELAGSTPELEYPAFNHTGYRYWNNVLSTCDSTDDGKCDTRCTAHVVVTFTGGYYDISLGHSYCPKVENRYLGPAVFHCEDKVFVTTCTIPLLE